MRRVLVFLILINISLFAYKYNDFLIKADAKIFPKIILLDKYMKNKIVNGSIKIAILYEENDLNTAIVLKSAIFDTNRRKLENYKLEVDLVNIKDFLNDDIKYNAIFILKTSCENFEQIAKKISNTGIVSFVYDKNDLEKGFLFSIDIENKPIIYMNKKALNKNFDFIPELYQLVRLIDNA